MNSPSSLGIIFIAIAVVFLGISFRNYLKTEGKLTIARKIWLRMAFIFAGVGIGLYLVHTFLR
jgi:polyferredoxin